MDLRGTTIAMLGGDRRELILLQELLQTGADVVAVGYPPLPELGRAVRVESVPEAVGGAQAVIAPMSNTDEAGVVRAVLDPQAILQLDEEAFRRMAPGTPLLIGAAKPIIEELAARYQIRLIQTAEQDEIAILNSIPTAEGAIWRAMGEMPTTIHGSRCVVLGFGRCGVTLARMLKSLGAHVTVAARNPSQIARAFEMGLNPMHLKDLAKVLPEVDLVFNTVPAMVLTRPLLSRLPAEGLVIDIASAPGGTDFAAARQLGVKAILELGIPGRVAPRTAGQILARTIPLLIAEAVGKASDR